MKNKKEVMMNYIKISSEDIANGAGIRCVLWISGCDINCKGCHNPQSHNYKTGKTFNQNTYNEISSILKKPYIQGITLSGGHPLAPLNREEIFQLCCKLKEDFPNKTIWLYTGYYLTESDVIGTNDTLIAKTIALCDVVVDGPYISEKRNLSLPFRGSENQRIIDINKSKLNKKVVQWEA